MQSSGRDSRIDRREFLGLAVAGGLAAPPSRHNVLLLMSDEHNPTFSQPYGHPFVQTPNMVRLARMGTTFVNTYCPSPLCMPSRSAFLSGRRVFDIQTYGNCNVFQGDYESYGKALRDAGVHSVHLGKTDVYNQASTLGFSEMLMPADRKPPGDTYISRSPLDLQDDASNRSAGYGVREKPFGVDARRMDTAIQWLERKASQVEGPWTLAVNLEKPHFPHNVTAELWEMYQPHADLPKHGRNCESAAHPYVQDLRKFFGVDNYGDEEVRNLRRGYYGCVTWVDRQLGRLLDTLETSGQLKDTVVIYTSDHGEMLGKFGMWWKRSLYEDSVRVPLIAAGPGFAAGRRVKTPVDLLDVQATLFRSTGARRPAGWVGRPLQEIAENDSNRVVFSEFQGGGTRASAFMVRKGRWKLIYCCAAPHQLFDLETDPEELVNLAGKRPDVLRRLERELREICSPEEENRRAEAYIRRQLQAIGRAVS